MLSQTQENVRDLMSKITAFDVLLESVGRTPKENEKAQSLFKAITERKLVLIEEVSRLLGAPGLEVK